MRSEPKECTGIQCIAPVLPCCHAGLPIGCRGVVLESTIVPKMRILHRRHRLQFPHRARQLPVRLNHGQDKDGSIGVSGGRCCFHPGVPLSRIDPCNAKLSACLCSFHHAAESQAWHIGICSVLKLLSKSTAVRRLDAECLQKQIGLQRVAFIVLPAEGARFLSAEAFAFHI